MPVRGNFKRVLKKHEATVKFTKEEELQVDLYLEFQKIVFGSLST